jgi:hypothetical protein
VVTEGFVLRGAIRCRQRFFEPGRDRVQPVGLSVVSLRAVGRGLDAQPGGKPTAGVPTLGQFDLGEEGFVGAILRIIRRE